MNGGGNSILRNGVRLESAHPNPSRWEGLSSRVIEVGFGVQADSRHREKAGVGFEPTNNGFAIRPIGPLWYPASHTPSRKDRGLHCAADCSASKRFCKTLRVRRVSRADNELMERPCSTILKMQSSRASLASRESRRSALECCAVSIVAACCTLAHAQSRGELPAVAPTTTNDTGQSVEPSLKLSISGLPDGFELKRSSSFGEGQIATNLPGLLIKTGAGDFVFLPDAGTRLSDAPLSPIAPAMVVMPSQRLGQIATSLQSRGDRARGSISGQMYSYRGRAFVLPTAMVFDAAKTEESASENEIQQEGERRPDKKAETDAATSSDSKSATSVVVSSGDSDNSSNVSEVIRDLESAWSTRRTIARPERVAGDNADKAASDSKPVMLVPERTLLSNVRGRLVRLVEASGRFAFAVDNDPNSPAAGSGVSGATGPMLILPNRQLEMIEDAVSQMGENASFALTARVMEYKGERYVLPIAFRVLTSGDIKPAQ